MVLTSVFRDNWWRLTGSNRRPPACKAGALPAELNPHSASITFAMLRCSTACVPTAYTALFRASPGSILEPDCITSQALPDSLRRKIPSNLTLVGLVGLEPTTPALSTRCSNQLSYRPDLARFGPASSVTSVFYSRLPTRVSKLLKTTDKCGYLHQGVL